MHTCGHKAFISYCIIVILAGYPASLGREGGWEAKEGEGGSEGRGARGGRGGRNGRGGGGEWAAREGGREGGRERPERSSGSLPPALPHCLLYFLKLYNVFKDNVQSIR